MHDPILEDKLCKLRTCFSFALRNSRVAIELPSPLIRNEFRATLRSRARCDMSRAGSPRSAKLRQIEFRVRYVVLARKSCWRGGERDGGWLARFTIGARVSVPAGGSLRRRTVRTIRQNLLLPPSSSSYRGGCALVSGVCRAFTTERVRPCFLFFFFFSSSLWRPRPKRRSKVAIDLVASSGACLKLAPRHR